MGADCDELCTYDCDGECSGGDCYCYCNNYGSATYAGPCSGSSLSGGAIFGIVVCVVFVLGTAIGVAVCLCRRKNLPPPPPAVETTAIATGRVAPPPPQAAPLVHTSRAAPATPSAANLISVRVQKTEQDLAGLSLKQSNGAIVVSQISPTGLFANTHLQPGMTLVSVNGIKTQGMDLSVVTSIIKATSPELNIMTVGLVPESPKEVEMSV